MNNGGPAFPTAIQISQDQSTGSTTIYQYLSDGMTLRDYFAAKAMQAIITGARDMEGGHLFYVEEVVAKNAYVMADTMLKEREKGNGQT